MLLKLLSISLYSIICYQDFKERMVHWFLFPILALVIGYSMAADYSIYFYLINVTYNVVFISTIIGILWVYTRLIKKIKFLNHSFGLGDLLLFYALCFGFNAEIFKYLLVCSIILSLLLHLLLRKKQKNPTIPLAAYVSLFFAIYTVLDLCLNVKLD